MEGGKPTVIANGRFSHDAVVVAFAKNGDRLVGQIAAKR